MARRQRVPRHKEHRKKRNQNPKLSPFQREQQRNKLANQAPITSIQGNKRDYPISQRAVMEYLMGRQARKNEKKQKLKEEAERAKEKEKEEADKLEREKNISEEDTVDIQNDNKDKRKKKKKRIQEKEEEEENNNINKRKKKRIEKKEEQEQEQKEENDETIIKEEKSLKRTKKNLLKAKKSSLPKPVILNEQIAATLAKPIIAFRTSNDINNKTNNNGGNINDPQYDSIEAKIARKKEKKHRKKSEARRERVRAQLHETEEKLKQEVLVSKNSKRRKKDAKVDPKDIAFEKKLKQMQKEKAEQEAAEKRAAKNNNNTTDNNNNKSNRKRISFNEGDGEILSNAPHHAMRYPNDKSNKKPSEFHELVDIVRFGERVEAPPVFDTLPRRDTSITRLANRLELSSHKSSNNNNKNNKIIGVAKSRNERLQLLSSIGGIGEQKRLERLGLTPINSSSQNNNNNNNKSKEENSKAAEMERLREAVMSAYRRNRRVDLESKKGVDMHHKFPLFSG